MEHQQIGRKKPKKGQKSSLCHHKQCIFDQKLAKTAKIRIFLDTTLSLNDSKQLYPDSGKVLDKSEVRFRRKFPKT